MMTSQLFGFFVGLAIFLLWLAAKSWVKVPLSVVLFDICVAAIASILLGACAGRLLEVLGSE